MLLQSLELVLTYRESGTYMLHFSTDTIITSRDAHIFVRYRPARGLNFAKKFAISIVREHLSLLKAD